MSIFTELEESVINLLSGGKSEHEICTELAIDLESYKSALSAILRKIDEDSVQSPKELGQALIFERARSASLTARLHAAEHLLRGLMAISPEGVLVVQGRSGIILDANEQSERLFGYSRKELVGMQVESLIRSEEMEMHVKQRQGFLRSIRKREIGYHPPILAVQKGGSLVELVVGLTSSTTSENVMVVCSLAADAGLKSTVPIPARKEE